MKIYDERGKQIGAIDRPEPVEQGGVWYEAVEFRSPKKGEMFKRCDKNHILPAICDEQDDGRWIMRPIPTPTSSQLDAIGMKLDGDRPTICVSGKCGYVWDGEHVLTYISPTHVLVGTYRWRLVKADPAKAKGEDASLTTPDGQIEAWKEVFAVCCELGMNIQTNLSGMEDVLAFIRDLHERAGEGYTVEQIQYYLGRCYLSRRMGTLYEAQTRINDPQDGIKAVTSRRGTK